MLNQVAAAGEAVREPQSESLLPQPGPVADPIDRFDAPGRSVSAPPEADYEVGYRKPPRHTQFKPGQSGNPKGRPRKALGLNTIILKHMLSSVQIKTAQGIERVTMIEALFLKALDSGSRGEFRAIEKLLAMYAAAVPETRAVSDAPPQPDAVVLTAADQEILDRLRAEIAAELQAAGETESSLSQKSDGADD